MKMEKRKKSLLVAALVVTALVLVVQGCKQPAGKRIFLSKEGSSTKEFFKEETVEFPEERICGNYDLRFDYADSVARFVGVIDRDMNGKYVLTILSEMAPRVLMLDIDGEGRIFCEELGSGTMSYRESIDKTSIKFKGEGYICTLTK